MDGISKLIDAGVYQSRSEAIRVAIHELLKRELWGSEDRISTANKDIPQTNEVKSVVNIIAKPIEVVINTPKRTYGHKIKVTNGVLSAILSFQNILRDAFEPPINPMPMGSQNPSDTEVFS